MLKYIAKKLLYGFLVLAGVVVLVFVLFQGFGDPARLVMGQSGDSTTQANIRKELYLDQPKWKQFVFYLNDVSPIAIHSSTEIVNKGLKGFFVGGEKKTGYQTALPAQVIPDKTVSKRCAVGSPPRHLDVGSCCHVHCCADWYPLRSSRGR